MPRRSALVVTTRDPFGPVGGDAVRLLNICSGLTEDFKLSLLSLSRDRDGVIRGRGPFTEVRYIRHPRWKSWTGAAARLTGTSPLQLGFFFSRELRREVRRRSRTSDVVLFHLIRAGQYAESVPEETPVVLEMTDVISRTYREIDRAEYGQFMLRKLYRFEEPRLRRYERRAAEASDLVVLVSNADQKALGNVGARVAVIPNGIPYEERTATRAEPTKDFLFIGKMTTVPNWDAALLFAREILPMIRSRVPRATFTVVGSCPARLRSKLERAEGVRVRGFVKDINDPIGRTQVGVAPLRAGSGMQNKILDCLAGARPVIASELAAEGIGISESEGLIPAPDRSSFAERAADLLNDIEKTRMLGRRGRKAIEERYGWNGKLAEYRQYVLRCVE